MSYVLNDIINIQRHRVKAALNLILQSKKNVDHAKITREKVAKDLYDYIKWCKNEEDRLFLEMINMYKRINHLDYYNQCIDSFKEKEKSLMDRLKKESENVFQAENELKKAKVCYAKCYRKKLKLEEHRANLRKVIMIEKGRINDTVMDEISVINFNAQLRNH